MYEYHAKVLRVIDADTIQVSIDLGLNVYHTTRLRLYGIDAWEIRGPEREKGLVAREYVLNLLTQYPEIRIRTLKDKTGKYGRYLAIVYAGPSKNIDLNEDLVKKGHAVRYE